MIFLHRDLLRRDLLISPTYVSDGIWCCLRSALDRRQNACLDSEITAAALVSALVHAEDPDDISGVRMVGDEKLGSIWPGGSDEFVPVGTALTESDSYEFHSWLYRCDDSITAIDGRLLDALGISRAEHATGTAVAGWVEMLRFGDVLIASVRRPRHDALALYMLVELAAATP